MSNTYRGALRVIVWLGDRPVEGDLINRLHVLARFIAWKIPESSIPDASETESSGTEATDPKSSTTDAKDTESSISALEEATWALEGLVQLPWFSRRWIIQEVVLHVDVTLFCHTSSISWARFINIVKDIARLESKFLRVISAFRKMFDLWFTYLRYEVDSDCELGHFLEAFDDIDCVDVRDRVFALLSLIQGTYAVKPDCTVDTQEV